MHYAAQTLLRTNSNRTTVNVKAGPTSPGEHPAAMQHGVSVLSCSSSPLLVLLALVLTLSTAALSARVLSNDAFSLLGQHAAICTHWITSPVVAGTSVEAPLKLRGAGLDRHPSHTTSLIDGTGNIRCDVTFSTGGDCAEEQLMLRAFSALHIILSTCFVAVFGNYYLSTARKGVLLKFFTRKTDHCNYFCKIL